MTHVCRKRNATPSLTAASTATRRAGRALVRGGSQSTRNTAQPVRSPVRTSTRRSTSLRTPEPIGDRSLRIGPVWDLTLTWCQTRQWGHGRYERADDGFAGHWCVLHAGPVERAHAPLLREAGSAEPRLHRSRHRVPLLRR